jgi:hypothetical protein
MSISSDHYNKSNSFSSSTNSNNSSSIRNNTNNNNNNNYSYNDSSNKFTSISSKYGNDSRFASVSSGPIEETSASTTSDTVLSYLGSFLYKTKEVATTIKDKVSEIDLTNTIELSKKTIDVLKYTGSVVYEKTSDIIVILYNIDFRHYEKYSRRCCR